MGNDSPSTIWYACNYFRHYVFIIVNIECTFTYNTHTSNSVGVDIIPNPIPMFLIGNPLYKENECEVVLYQGIDGWGVSDIGNAVYCIIELVIFYWFYVRWFFFWKIFSLTWSALLESFYSSCAFLDWELQS